MTSTYIDEILRNTGISPVFIKNITSSLPSVNVPFISLHLKISMMSWWPGPSVWWFYFSVRVLLHLRMMLRLNYAYFFFKWKTFIATLRRKLRYSHFLRAEITCTCFLHSKLLKGVLILSPIQICDQHPHNRQKITCPILDTKSSTLEDKICIHARPWYILFMSYDALGVFLLSFTHEGSFHWFRQKREFASFVSEVRKHYMISPMYTQCFIRIFCFTTLSRGRGLKIAWHAVLNSPECAFCHLWPRRKSTPWSW